MLPAPLILATTLPSFLPSPAAPLTSFFHKIAFDHDTIGRTRQTALLEETARVAYAAAGIPVNIAVWNMHIPETHHFERILESGLQPMGLGGGFRVVVFQGKGWLRNQGVLGDAEWRWSGKGVVVKGNLVEFRDVDAGWWGVVDGMGEWAQRVLW